VVNPDSDLDERLLDRTEDALDRAELRAAREDDDYVHWDEVKSDLDLT
jgi:hypothetical protein